MRITNTQSAITYLESIDHAVTVNADDTVTEVRACTRCGGSGRYGPPSVNAGRCFQCNGKYTRYEVHTPVKEYAQRIKRKRNANEKRKVKALTVQEARLQGQRERNDERGLGALTNEELRTQRAAERDAVRESERAKAKPVPTGRMEIIATIVSLKVQETAYGMREVMTIKSVKDGYVLWGSQPRGLDLNVGNVITMTATVEPSDRDEKFGFFKRPAKASINQEEQTV